MWGIDRNGNCNHSESYFCVFASQYFPSRHSTFTDRVNMGIVDTCSLPSVGVGAFNDDEGEALAVKTKEVSLIWKSSCG